MADAIEALEKSDIVEYYRRQVVQGEAAALVGMSAGRLHQKDFQSAQQSLNSDAILIEDNIDSYNAFKQSSEVFTFR